MQEAVNRGLVLTKKCFIPINYFWDEFIRSVGLKVTSTTQIFIKKCRSSESVASLPAFVNLLCSRAYADFVWQCIYSKNMHTHTNYTNTRTSVLEM